MATMARAASLREYPALVDELGGNGLALLGRFGITPDALGADQAIIPAESIGWALEVAAAELNCPDFGLRLAARQGTAVLGPLAIALSNAATIGEAIECASRFLFTHHTGITIGLTADPERESGSIGLELRDPAERHGLAQGIDLAAGTIHHGLRQALGGDYGLRSVHLPHPPLLPPDRYAEYFGAPVRFDSDRTVFRVPDTLPARPVTGSNETLRTMAMDYLTRHFPALERTMSARVRVAIDQTISDKPEIDTVARMLTMHERTLQRALATEGTTFSELLDDARREAVHRLLCETDLPMSRITTLVSLHGQSALTKMVRRWFGATPQQVRNSARARDGERLGDRSAGRDTLGRIFVNG